MSRPRMKSFNLEMNCQQGLGRMFLNLLNQKYLHHKFNFFHSRELNIQ